MEKLCVFDSVSRKREFNDSPWFNHWEVFISNSFERILQCWWRLNLDQQTALIFLMWFQGLVSSQQPRSGFQLGEVTSFTNPWGKSSVCPGGLWGCLFWNQPWRSWGDRWGDRPYCKKGIRFHKSFPGSQIVFFLKLPVISCKHILQLHTCTYKSEFVEGHF